MSHRPVNKKKVRKLRKAFRRQLPAYIDPVEYVMDRGFAQTKGEARKLILGGGLRSESHRVGIVEVPVLDTTSPTGFTNQKRVGLVPAELRSTLMVVKN